jgi:hypothetical protein
MKELEALLTILTEDDWFSIDIPSTKKYHQVLLAYNSLGMKKAAEKYTKKILKRCYIDFTSSFLVNF